MVGSPLTSQHLTAALVRGTGARAISLGYRLAPEHPFPAAIENGAAAYREPLFSGVPAAQIIRAGDSSGVD